MTLDPNYAPPGTVAQLWDYYSNQDSRINFCTGCHFHGFEQGCQRKTRHSCVASNRPDRCWVIYVQKTE